MARTHRWADEQADLTAMDVLLNAISDANEELRRLGGHARVDDLIDNGLEWQRLRGELECQQMLIGRRPAGEHP